MKIAVAMGTYNAAGYLPDQLRSIAEQECLPDELVVCDDRSTDETVAIVRRFAAEAPFEVRLETNERRLGCRGNFAKAIGLCRGRLILLADQDDVWMPHKVRCLKDAFAENPEIGFAFSDAVIVDRQLRGLGYRLWEVIGFTRREQRQMGAGRAMGVLLRRNVVTGSTMAFRAEYRDLLLPIPAGWIHDAWIALMIAAVAGCKPVAEPLIQYRQHANQQIGEKKRNLYQQYLRGREKRQRDFELTADNYAAAHDRLLQFQSRLRSGDTIGELRRKVSHFQAKVRMRSRATWRLPVITREFTLHHYARYSLGWKSLAQDLFL